MCRSVYNSSRIHNRGQPFEFRPRLASNAPRTRLSVQCTTRREWITATSISLSIPQSSLAFAEEELAEPVPAQLTAVPLGLSIAAPKKTLPPTWYPDFQKLIGFRNRVRIQQKASMDSLYHELLQRKLAQIDLVALGDAWLPSAIRKSALIPFSNPIEYRQGKETLNRSSDLSTRWFNQLSRRWQRFVTRDRHGELSDVGQIWAVPFRWGSVLVGYKEPLLQKVGIQGIHDWKDLLHPKLKNRIAWMNSPRHLAGLSLKSLGASFNTGMKALKSKGNPSLEEAKDRIDAFKDQSLVFSNEDHIRALISGDAWVCVGLSLDLLPLRDLITDLKIVLPMSGSAIWSDNFVIPSRDPYSLNDLDGPSSMVNAWLDYVLSPARSREGDRTRGWSPLDLPQAVETPGRCSDSVELDSKNRFLPNPCALARSEFVFPLDDDLRQACEYLLT